MKIYVPNLTTNNCVIVYDKDTIRVFETAPQDNTLVNYTDYFVNSHYLSTTGSIIYATGNDVTCLSSSNLTSDFYYRNDLDSILVIFIIIVIFCFYFPYRLISRAFGRWLKI